MIIQKPITPEWGDAAVRSWTTGLRIVFPGKTNDDHDPKLFESFRLIFTGVFHDIFIRTWPVYEFNKLLLSPPRFRRTLIVYFQLIMKILLQKLILMSQPPKQSAVGSWENSSEVLSSWRLFGSERAEPQRTIPFFAEIARRSLAEREGGNIQILKSLKENTDKGVKGRFVFVFVHFVFSGYFITGLHVY